MSPLKKYPLLSIFLIVLVDVMGFTLILPLLPFYAENLGATPSTIGFLISTYGLCQLIAGPILGQISDRVGRKPVLLVSQIGTLAGFLILAFAKSLGPIFLSRAIDGLTAGNLAVAQAYIADVTEPKNRAKSFGLIGIAFGLGFLVGPAISGFLSHFDHQYPIFMAAALSAASIAGTFFLLPSPPQAPDYPEPWRDKELGLHVYKECFQNKELAPLLWQFLAFIFAFAFFISGFALFAERRFTYQGMPFGAKEVGYVFAYTGLLGIIVQAGLIGRLVHAFGEKKLVRFGFIGMFLGFCMLGWIRTIPLLLAAATVSFVGSSVLRPSLISLITQKIGRNQQGTAIGLTQSLFSVSQIIAPVLSGMLIQKEWLTPWALTGALISGSGFVLVRGG